MQAWSDLYLVYRKNGQGKCIRNWNLWSYLHWCIVVWRHWADRSKLWKAPLDVIPSQGKLPHHQSMSIVRFEAQSKSLSKTFWLICKGKHVCHIIECHSKLKTSLNSRYKWLAFNCKVDRGLNQCAKSKHLRQLGGKSWHDRLWVDRSMCIYTWWIL